MPNLLELPDELLLLIAGAVARHDVENWSLTCRKLFDNSAAALKAHRFRKRFSNIIIELPSSSLFLHYGQKHSYFMRSWANHPLWLLRAMLKDQYIEIYIDTLKITRQNLTAPMHPLAELADPQPCTVEESDDSQQIHAIQSDRLRDQLLLYHLRIQNTITGARFPTKHAAFERWYNRLFNQTRADATTILMLLQLQNLRKLTLEKNFGSAEEFLLKVLIRKSQSLASRAARPFGKLTEVEIGSDSTTSLSSPLSLIWMFCSLQSVRTVNGIDLYAYASPKEGGPPQIESSLSLKDCDARICNSICAFGKPTSMKTFCLTTKYVVNGPSSVVEVAKWLWEYSTGTLEELIFHRSYLSDPSNVRASHFIGSLRHFERLRVAKIMSTAFTQWDIEEDAPLPGRLCRLVDVLPASLEVLVMVGNGPVDTMNELFIQMYQLKQARLPKLRQVVFEEDVQLYHETVQELGTVGLQVVTGNGKTMLP